MQADDDDRQALIEALRGVRPLTHAGPRPAPPPRHPRAGQRRADEREVLRESLTTSPVALDVETGEELLFRRAGVPADVLRGLRRGRYTVAAELDLHGLTEREAKQVLRDFLAEALDHDHRCVRIVHGKGRGSGPRGPVLKRAVNHWLRQTAAVQAFASARSADGGTGAVYVLLSP
ncbi:MAG: Smr/MutS family protein [Steroidobacteraceae bacterium]